MPLLHKTLRVLSNGDGFADDFGKEEVFKTSPQELKEMLKQKMKEVREKYEHLDLDGNEQSDYKEHHSKSILGKIRKSRIKRIVENEFFKKKFYVVQTKNKSL